MNKNKKRMAKGIAAAALIGVIAVGSTLAYLSSVTETKTNVFTSDKNINANLTETKWNEEETYIPGVAKEKNPVIENQSSNAPMWTGVKIEFIKKEKQSGTDTFTETPITYEQFKTQYGELIGNTSAVDGINAGWTKVTGYDDNVAGIFVKYNTLLQANVKTDPAVFDAVKVNAAIKKVYNTKYTETSVYPALKNEDGTYAMDANGNYQPDTSQPAISSTSEESETSVIYTDESGKKIDDIFELPTFDIKVTGYAVQDSASDGFDHDAELLKLAGLN